MKEECEQLFIELVSPYLTALEASKGCSRSDWHGVFAFAEDLKAEMASLRKTRIEEPIASNLDEVKDLASDLADIAINQESRIIHHEEPSFGLDMKATELLAELQGKLRGVIVDNVCACEAGAEIITAYEEGKFPQQDKALATIKGLSGPVSIVHVHDDGDLTVEAAGIKYVVTIEGDIFGQQ